MKFFSFSPSPFLRVLTPPHLTTLHHTNHEMYNSRTSYQQLMVSGSAGAGLTVRFYVACFSTTIGTSPSLTLSTPSTPSTPSPSTPSTPLTQHYVASRSITQHSRSTHAALTQHSRSTHTALTQHSHSTHTASHSTHAALTQHSRSSDLINLNK